MGSGSAQVQAPVKKLTTLAKCSNFYRGAVKRLLNLTKDEQVLTNRQSLWFNFFLTLFFVTTRQMGITLAVFYVFLTFKGKWNVAVVHASLVGLSYCVELAVYHKAIDDAADYVGIREFSVSFNYLYIIAFILLLKFIAMSKEKIFDGPYSEIKIVNSLYLVLTFYYLLSQCEAWDFKISIFEYARFYFMVILRGYVYSTYHYFSHNSNVLWSIHKSHHYAISRESGDGNTISILEFAVAWIPITGLIDPGTECVLRFLHILGDMSVHDYKLGKYHQLHHLFHNTNIIIPVIGKNYYGYTFPREFMDQEHEDEFRENYHEYVDTFDIYAKEDNDIEPLNKAMHPAYTKFMKRVAARKVANAKFKIDKPQEETKKQN
jgi:hypothetical protein